MNTRAISKNGKKSLASFLVLHADRKLTMALIKCSECGKDVSDKATACPNCGAPASSGRARQRRDNTPVRVVRAGWRWEVIGALFVIGGLIAAHRRSKFRVAVAACRPAIEATPIRYCLNAF